MTRELAAALLLLSGAAQAADVSDGYVQGPGGFYKQSDRSGPYSIGPTGTATLLGSGMGSQEQDVTESRTLNAATVGAQQTYTLNGQATFSFNLAGLTASGATVSFFQSNDWNGTTGTFTPVSEVNTGNGVPSLTRTTDGQSAIGIEGSKAVRVQVTTAGTGTITLASNISVRSRYTAIRSPTPVYPALGASWTQVADVSCAANTLCPLSSATSRKFFSVVNTTSSGLCRVAYGSITPSSTRGDPLAPASITNGQGGTRTFENGYVPNGTIAAFCTAASTLAVMEGN